MAWDDFIYVELDIATHYADHPAHTPWSDDESINELFPVEMLDLVFQYVADVSTRDYRALAPVCKLWMDLTRGSPLWRTAWLECTERRAGERTLRHEEGTDTAGIVLRFAVPLKRLVKGVWSDFVADYQAARKKQHQTVARLKVADDEDRALVEERALREPRIRELSAARMQVWILKGRAKKASSLEGMVVDGEAPTSGDVYAAQELAIALETQLEYEKTRAAATRAEARELQLNRALHTLSVQYEARAIVNARFEHKLQAALEIALGRLTKQIRFLVLVAATTERVFASSPLVPNNIPARVLADPTDVLGKSSFDLARASLTKCPPHAVIVHGRYAARNRMPTWSASKLRQLLLTDTYAFVVGLTLSMKQLVLLAFDVLIPSATEKKQKCLVGDIGARLCVQHALGRVSSVRHLTLWSISSRLKRAYDEAREDLLPFSFITSIQKPWLATLFPELESLKLDDVGLELLESRKMGRQLSHLSRLRALFLSGGGVAQHILISAAMDAEHCSLPRSLDHLTLGSDVASGSYIGSHVDARRLSPAASDWWETSSSYQEDLRASILECIMSARDGVPFTSMAMSIGGMKLLACSRAQVEVVDFQLLGNSVGVLAVHELETSWGAGPHTWKTVAGLGNGTALKRLALTGGNFLSDVAGLQFLQELNLRGMGDFSSVAVLGTGRLQRLNLSLCKGVTCVRGLHTIPELNLASTGVREVNHLGTHKDSVVRHLNLRMCEHLVDVGGLKNISRVLLEGAVVRWRLVHEGVVSQWIHRVSDQI